MIKRIAWVTIFVIYNFCVISLHQKFNYSFKPPYVHSKHHYLNNLSLKRAKNNLDIFLKDFFANEGSGIGIGKKDAINLSIALHNILETVVNEFTTSVCNVSNANVSVESGTNKNDSVSMSLPTRSPAQSNTVTPNSKPLKSVLISTSTTPSSHGISNVTALRSLKNTILSISSEVKSEHAPVFSNTLQGTEKYARYAVSIPVQLKDGLPLDMGMANVLAIYHAIRLFSGDTIDLVV